MITVAVTMGIWMGVWPGACSTGHRGCYDYDTRTIHVATWDPEVITHELGHAWYFQQSSEVRQSVSVGDSTVRDEEAFADVFAACVQGYGPRWMSTHLYRVKISLERFKTICRTIKGYA